MVVDPAARETLYGFEGDFNDQHRSVMRSPSMKINKLIALAAVAFATLSPIVATAQTSPGGGAADTTVSTTNDRDNHHDYGWIGLVGLLGLAGLMNKRREDTIDTRTTAAARR
jgi:hypothetical protein